MRKINIELAKANLAKLVAQHSNLSERYTALVAELETIKVKVDAKQLQVTEQATKVQLAETENAEIAKTA